MTAFDRRTSFVCYPASGAAMFTIRPAWITILRPGSGAPRIITRSGEQGVTARVRCKYTWPLAVGDLLSDNDDGRVLLVKQVARQQQQQEVLCEEIRRPLPDEFETIALRADWTVASGAEVLNQAAMASYLQLQLPVAATIATAGMIGQWVKGDFDVWAFALMIESASVVNGATSASLILARDGEGKGVGIGVRNTGTGTEVTQEGVRLDQQASGQSEWTQDLTGLVATSARLRRVGSRIYSYVSRYAWESVQEEIPHDFWVEMRPAVQSISAADLFVGIGGIATDTRNVLAQFIRNWLD